MTDLPRLLHGLRPDGQPLTLPEHLHRHGTLPRRLDPASLVDAVERSGLRGRGGAGFPTALKLRAVASRRGRKVVVANGAEGEPPSGKDKVLLRYVPHLVLDGVAVAAVAVGADEAIVAVSRAATAELAALQEALARARPQRPCRDSHRGRPRRVRHGRGVGARQRRRRRPRSPDVDTAAPLRAWRRRRADARPERRDTRAPRARRPPRTRLVPRARHPRRAGKRARHALRRRPAAGRLRDRARHAAPRPRRAGGRDDRSAARRPRRRLLRRLARRGRRLRLRRQPGLACRRGRPARRPRDRRPAGGRMRGRRGRTRQPLPRRRERRPVRPLRPRARRRRRGERLAPPVGERRRGPAHPALAGADPRPRRLPPSRRRRAVRRAARSSVRGRVRRHALGRRCGGRDLGLLPVHRRRETRAVSFRLRVDPIACDGHGLCAELFPEGIAARRLGLPARGRPADPALARAACPAGGRRLPGARAEARAGGGARTGGALRLRRRLGLDPSPADSVVFSDPCT